MATVYYKIIDLNQYLSDVETQLNTYGTDGWELSTIYNEQAILISGSSGITVTGSVVLPSGVVSSSLQASGWTVLSSSFATTSSFAITSSYILPSGLPSGTVSSSKQINTGSFTGSFVGTLTGTGSWATNAISSSYALTSSYAVSSSHANNSDNSISSSYALSSSYAVTASHVPTAYGQWYSMETQSGSANTVLPMRYNSESFANGFTYSGSRIYALRNGIYNMQFSAQFANTANNNAKIDVWVRQDGNNIIDSNTLYEINKQPSDRGTVVAALNYMLQMNSGSYAEIVWTDTNAGTVQLYSTGSGTNPTRPAVPSIITTITQIV